MGNPSAKEFRTACAEIGAKMTGIKKAEPPEDADGTVIQIYDTGSKKVKVVTDLEVDAVYVDSETGLSGTFH